MKAIEISEVVTGNYFNKYETSNPIARRLVEGFLDTLSGLLSKVDDIDSIHEIGCGEGFLAHTYASMATDIRGTDISPECIEMAKARAATGDFHIEYKAQNVYDLNRENDSADLVICCEVMEHLEDSERALEILSDLTNKYLICSVPREPLWRILNFARGKYWGALGNTPGHLQHWSSRGFQKLISQRFEIIEVRQPLPWTFVFAKKR